MPRPRVICHMVASIDGRVAVDGWPDAVSTAVRRQYEEVHATYEAEGWLCGRVTMASFAKLTRSEADVAHEHRGPVREDFVAPGDHRSFAFAVDSARRLAWESNEIGGDHVIAILSERVSDEHLAFLRARGVSYLLAGAREVDLPLALEKIGSVFGVKMLMLEGGGRINGGMLRASLLDEVSVLLAPVLDGRMGTPALFHLDAGALAPRRLELMKQAIGAARPGGYVSYVGVPHGVQLDGQKLFFTHVHLHGRPAPLRRFLPRLIELIEKRTIDPGKVFDLTLPLEQVAEGYRAMGERRAIKTLLRV